MTTKWQVLLTGQDKRNKSKGQAAEEEDEARKDDVSSERRHLMHRC